jgi:hypothetical protein
VTSEAATVDRPVSPAPSRVGVIASGGLLVVLLAFAVTVDIPKASRGFKGDEATYYSLAHSLARDFDFAFERDDLVRVWEEFPGPEGIFLKRGKVSGLRPSRQFPFLRWVKREDPVRTRFYYSKSYIYPLAASPFVFLFGTNGFYVLHAFLLALDLLVAYVFVAARGGRPVVALAYASVFLVASVVPVYFVWMTPELFNLSLALYALFLWTYKEVSPAPGPGRWSRWLRGPGSDVAAAALIGLLTFSKPPHAILMGPLVLLAIGRRQWLRGIGIIVGWAVVAGALFAANATITGEFNYQGGDRKTFYSNVGFPLANERETFDNIGPPERLEAVLPADILLNPWSLTVFRHNLTYFTFGRYCGLVPYFFPGVVSALMFFARGPRRSWQWLLASTIVGSALVFLLLTPFTYSGGGAPVGNRYYLSFYALFLFLTPIQTGFGAALTTLVIGSLFTAKILLNPFYSSFYPGEHAKTGPLRWLPIELTLLNDLPMATSADRFKRPLGGTPPVLAYFPDDNAFNPEGDKFWVKGKSLAEVILRAPVVDAGQGRYVTKAITKLNVEIQNGGKPDRVTISTGRETRTLNMEPAEIARVSLEVDDGVPYHRGVQPTSFAYVISIRTTSGFVPFLEAPGSKDNRFLGALIQLAPEYRDAGTWSSPTSEID